MDAKLKRNKDVPAATDAANGPVKVLRIDDVSVSIFARERTVQGEPVTFHSVSFSRSYKDAEGKRNYTKTFDAEDLGKIVSLAQQANEYLNGLDYHEGAAV